MVSDSPFWVTRRSGLLVPANPRCQPGGVPVPGASGAAASKASVSSAAVVELEPELQFERVPLRSRCEVSERLAIVRRDQMFGFAALALVMVSIVTLAAMGQRGLAQTVATDGLAVVVGLFGTWRHVHHATRSR
jgi:hypothetical protein